VPPHGYGPMGQPQSPYGQPWPQQAVPTLVLWGRPLHFWLLVASAIAVVALFMPWYSTQVSGYITTKTMGYEYSDGTRSTWDVPQAVTSSYGGGNGLNIFTLALAGAIGGLALKFRSGSWPRWAAFTLAGVVGLVIFIGLINLAFDANLGPLLFAVAGGLAVPGALQLVRSAR
jgi:hypothetical protein